MANQADGFEFPIRVTGADAAAAELRKVAAAKEEAAKPVSSGNPFEGKGLTSSALASPRPDLGGAKELTAEQQEQAALAQRKLAIDSTRLAIVEQEEAMLAAVTAGETERAVVLQRELNVLREQVSLLRTVTVSEEQALRIAEARVLADEKDAIAKRAQAAALEAERAAARSSLGGDGGRLGQIGRAAGLGGAAATAGFAGLIGGQIVNEVMQYAEELERAQGAGEGLTRELYEQVKQWQQLAQAAASQEDVDRLTKATHATIERTRDTLIEVKDGWDDTAKSVLGAVANVAQWNPMLAASASSLGELVSGWQTVSEIQREGAINAIGQQEILAEANRKIAESEAKNADTIRAANEARQERVQAAREEAEAEREVERELERQTQQRAKEAQQINEILSKREALAASLAGEIPIMQARLAGDDRQAQLLEVQLQTRQQIDQLARAGVLTPELQAQIETLSKLKEQQIIQQDKAKKDKEAAAEAEREAKAREKAANEAERAKRALDGMKVEAGEEAFTKGSKGNRARKAAEDRFAQEARDKAKDAGLDEGIAERNARNAYRQSLRDKTGRTGDKIPEQEKFLVDKAPAAAKPQFDQAAEKFNSSTAGMDRTATAANAAATAMDRVAGTIEGAFASIDKRLSAMETKIAAAVGQAKN